MSLSHSPKVITDGLVFYYDMSNRQKSWKGEPTTNIVPSPEHNGRFTLSNGWGTYNTNQYNGAQYFSIGTVNSVSGNIVTMSSTHPLRTFDVVTPQTTGGGLTAGTNYLIKRISNTQFSVHEYNGSQNGSQGYIDPSTGYHKVHESIALNQRVSINTASFPTMWWGPPHLPNSGLVKEIVDGVGPQGQSVMRLHIPRTDGVADGMAYGVYVPVTAGQTINVSYWQRTNYPGKNLGYSTYFGPGAAYGSSYTSNSLEWERVSFQWTASVTFSFYQYWWPSGSTDRPYWFDIADLQVEVNTQSGDTPFTLSTRANTQAILDLTNNNTVTANSLTYASDGTFSFNRTNSPSLTTSLPLTSLPALSNFTLNTWLKITSLPPVAANNGVIFGATYYSGTAIYWKSNGSTFTINGFIRGNDSYRVTASYTLPLNAVHNIVLTNDKLSNTLNLYVNGALFSSVATATQEYNQSLAASAGNIKINAPEVDGGGSEVYTYFTGIVYSASIYNRALSATEVQQNFQALRVRYGI